MLYYYMDIDTGDKTQSQKTASHWADRGANIAFYILGRMAAYWA